MRIVPAPLVEKNISGKEYFPIDVATESLLNRITKIENTEWLIHTWDEPDSTTAIAPREGDMSLLSGLLNQSPKKLYPYDIIENTPLNLSLPKKNSAHLGEFINTSFVPQPSMSVDQPLQRRHDRRANTCIPADYGREQKITPKTDGEKSRIVVEACLPDSSCYKTAKHYNIPQLHISMWCQNLFGITITELQNELKVIGKSSVGADDIKPEEKPTSMDSARFRKRLLLRERKKQILLEICVGNMSVSEYCKHLKLSPSNIYRWCKAIYQMKFRELQKQVQSRLQKPMLSS